MGKSRYQPIATSIWNNSGKFRKYTDTQKVLWLYLLTCKHSNCLGLYYLPAMYASHDLNWKVDKFLITIESFSESVCEIDPTTEMILIKNHFKYRPLENPNQVTGAITILENLPKTNLIIDLYYIIEGLKDCLLNPLLKRLETLSEPYRNPSNRVTEYPSNRVTEKKHIVRTPEKAEPGQRSLDICQKLADKIKAYRPNHKPIDIKKGAKIIDLMVSRDKRTHEEMELLIDWYPIGEKYIPEIFSIQAFREKYDKLYSAMGRAKYSDDTNTEKLRELENAKYKVELEEAATRLLGD